MSKPMDAKELKKVIDASIYPPFLRKEAKDFVDGLVAELEAHRGTLAAAREYWDRGMPNFNSSTVEFPFELADEINEFFAALPSEPRTEAK